MEPIGNGERSAQFAITAVIIGSLQGAVLVHGTFDFNGVERIGKIIVSVDGQTLLLSELQEVFLILLTLSDDFRPDFGCRFGNLLGAAAINVDGKIIVLA